VPVVIDWHFEPAVVIESLIAGLIRSVTKISLGIVDNTSPQSGPKMR